MTKGQLFLAGTVFAAFSCALASYSAAAPQPDFVFSNGSVDETVYTINSIPVSCADFPAASDSYSWKVRLAKIKGTFIQAMANNVVITAFNSGTCDPIDDVTNTLEIPPAAVFIHVDSSGLTDVDFDGAIPDFNTVNTSNDIDLPFFNAMGFHLVFNQKSTTIGGLAPATGTLEVTGNANLCGALTSSQPQQCFILDLDEGDSSNDDFACICVTPTVQSIDLTSFLLP